MESAAQRKATTNYRKGKTKSLSITLFPKDQDIIDWLDKQPRKAQYIRDLIRNDMAAKEHTMHEKYPRNYKFVSADGQNVEVKVSGDYQISSDHDWDVLTDTDQAFIEQDDGSGVMDWLDENVQLEDNQRHFAENMIVTVMAYNDMTFEQLLDYQAEYESKKH